MNEQTRQADIAKVVDDALETLRGARGRVEERGTSQTLRELETRLGYLAQSLSWDMDGEPAKAAIALRLAQGLSKIDERTLEEYWASVWWSH
ncbi:MAG TPA: hypothetical protein VI759_05285 [Dehalococcoidia bacterium]|nr:hypothetical protein [Dehalococcoidia bacterium]